MAAKADRAERATRKGAGANRSSLQASGGQPEEASGLFGRAGAGVQTRGAREPLLRCMEETDARVQELTQRLALVEMEVRGGQGRGWPWRNGEGLGTLKEGLWG